LVQCESDRAFRAECGLPLRHAGEDVAWSVHFAGDGERARIPAALPRRMPDPETPLVFLVRVQAPDFHAAAPPIKSIWYLGSVFAAGFQLIRIAACPVAISGSILARPDCCLVIRIALPRGSVLALPTTQFIRSRPACETVP